MGRFKKFPSEIQRNIMDCGATCLRIIARYYGRQIPIEYLREQTQTTRAGATLYGISTAAETIGLRTLGVKISFENLQVQAPLPLIAHWGQNHFVVVYKVTTRKVYLSDPGSGLLSYTHSEFIKRWMDAFADTKTEAGICLLFEATPEFSTIIIPNTSDNKINTKSFLLHYIRPQKKLIFQIFSSLLFGSLLQLTVPFLTQGIIDTGIMQHDIRFIWLVLLAQLMITVGQMALELMRNWMMLYLSSRIDISLISDFFAKLMKLPIRYFDVKLSGDLMQRIQDHKRIESFLTSTSFNVIFSLFSLLIYGVVLAYYNVSLFLIFLSGSAVYIAWILFFLKKREKLDYKRFQQAGETNSKVVELISGMQEIKLHNAEQQKRWGWERIQVKLYRLKIQSLKLEQAQSVGSRIINEVKNICTTIIAAQLVINGKLTLGMMLSISYIIGQLNAPVVQLVGVIRSWQDARISLDRLTEIYQKGNENNIPSTGDIYPKQDSNPLISPGKYDLSLNAVSFSYNKFSTDVLKQVDLFIPKGKVTAIVGSSGSGKTTLMKLLMRFYEPTSGTISVGNTNLEQIGISKWRESCGVVMQEGFIFNDTISGNIAIGEDAPDKNRLEQATAIANIKEFIEELPLKFATKIGQEGLGISTGQKQRILIARAVYKNPDVLFFDEATSSLDANNEREIMDHLKEFYVGKTVVIIAHRLSTVKDADQIVVLEKGHIIEQGTHTTLAHQKGTYYELVKNQLELGK